MVQPLSIMRWIVREIGVGAGRWTSTCGGVGEDAGIDGRDFVEEGSAGDHDSSWRLWRLGGSAKQRCASTHTSQGAWGLGRVGIGRCVV